MLGTLSSVLYETVKNKREGNKKVWFQANFSRNLEAFGNLVIDFSFYLHYSFVKTLAHYETSSKRAVAMPLHQPSFDMYLEPHKNLLSKSERIVSYMAYRSSISRDKNMMFWCVFLNNLKDFFE